MIRNNQMTGKSSYIRIPYESGKTDLKDVLEILTNRYSDKFEFVDTRTDFYAYVSKISGSCLYDECLYNEKVLFQNAYIIKDKISNRYIYFIVNGDILITTSDKYDSSENICWQENIPKGYVSAPEKYSNSDGVKKDNNERYIYETYPCMYFISMGYNKISDVYIINNGQSFAIICRSATTGIAYKKKDGRQDYFIYDTSDKYHTDNNLVSCIHTSGNIWSFGCVNTGHIRVTIGDNLGPVLDCKNYTSLLYVPADTYDNGESGYYFEYQGIDSIEELTPHNNLIHKYLIEPINRTQELPRPTTLQTERPSNESIYNKNYSFDKNFVSFSCTAMNIYMTQDLVPKYGQTAFNKNNSTGNHLDINLYSGLRSTLNNMSIAFPNIVYILRQPFVLKDISAVEESTFMYMIDMEDKSNGDIVEYIDNYGNKIKLICFMTYQSVTNLNSKTNTPKQLGIGIRLE